MHAGNRLWMYGMYLYPPGLFHKFGLLLESVKPDFCMCLYDWCFAGQSRGGEHEIVPMRMPSINKVALFEGQWLVHI